MQSIIQLIRDWHGFLQWEEVNYSCDFTTSNSILSFILNFLQFPYYISPSKFTKDKAAFSYLSVRIYIKYSSYVFLIKRSICIQTLNSKNCILYLPLCILYTHYMYPGSAGSIFMSVWNWWCMYVRGFKNRIRIFFMLVSSLNTIVNTIHSLSYILNKLYADYILVKQTNHCSYFSASLLVCNPYTRCTHCQTKKNYYAKTFH